MKIVKAVNEVHRPNFEKIVFLAGSIENGKAEDWQEAVTNSLKYYRIKDHVLLVNPRREKWNPDWLGSKEHKPELDRQINWELDYLINSTHVLFNFCKYTISPISLLELGMISMKYSQRSILPRKLFVNVEEGYQRIDNVQLTMQFLEKTYGLNIFTYENDIHQATWDLSRELL